VPVARPSMSVMSGTTNHQLPSIQNSVYQYVSLSSELRAQCMHVAVFLWLFANVYGTAHGMRGPLVKIVDQSDVELRREHIPPSSISSSSSTNIVALHYWVGSKST
jgi:hypothetical protein